MKIYLGYYQGSPTMSSEFYMSRIRNIYYHTGYFFISGNQVFRYAFSCESAYYLVVEEAVRRNGTLCDYEVKDNLLIVISRKGQIFEHKAICKIISEIEFEGDDGTFKFNYW